MIGQFVFCLDRGFQNISFLLDGTLVEGHVLGSLFEESSQFSTKIEGEEDDGVLGTLEPSVPF